MFQLPLQLLLLECHKLEREYLTNRDEEETQTPEVAATPNNDVTRNKPDNTANIPRSEQDNNSNTRWPALRRIATDWGLWKIILFRVATNPVIWGIIIGFVIYLTTFGKRFLTPTSEHYSEWLQFVVDSMSWVGDCFSPISLFAMGVWMQYQGHKLVTIGFGELFLFMLYKLVLIPIIMVGLAKAFGL